MNNQVDKFAKTVDEAIEQSLQDLGIDIDDAVIEVLDEGEPGGLLGFGRRPAHVRVSRAYPQPEEEIATRVEDDTPLNPRSTEPDLAREDDTPEPDEELSSDEDDLYEEASREESENRRSDFSAEEKVQLENQAVEFVATVLQNLDIHGKISSYYADDGCLRIDVSGDDLGNAIGRRGETLYAIQYLTTLAINKDPERYQRVYVDIDFYRDRRIHQLRQSARKSAERVLKSGKRYVLRPMSAGDRRQVHLALADFQGIVTYSEGEEPRRSVVIDRDKSN